MDSVQIDSSENPREFKQKGKPQAKTQGQMTCEFLKISLPLLIYENMFYVIVVINVIFAGRLNDSTKMAGIGLGTTFNHMFGLCVFFGINTAMETLITQTYGYGNMKLCGVYLNRARVIGTLIFIPVTCLLLNSKHILLACGQDPETVEYASQYTRQMIPAIYVMNLCDMQEKFLIFMHQPSIVMVSQILAALFHAPLCYYFVDYLQMDLAGLSYATFFSFSIHLAFLLLFTARTKEIQEAVQMPDASTFKDWGSFLDFALPSLLTSCSDWWAYEILVLLSGYAGVVSQAAFVITATITYQILVGVLGISAAACTLIGTAIGRQDVPLAKRYYKMSLSYTLIYSLTVTILLMIFKSKIAGVFTNDKDVQAMIVVCLPVVALKCIPDGFQAMLGIGVIPALGLQNKGFKITVSVAYLVTIPSACLYAFVLNHGIVGLTWGAATGHIVQAGAYAICILACDWEQVSRDAAQRIEEDDFKQREAVRAKWTDEDDLYSRV